MGDVEKGFPGRSRRVPVGQGLLRANANEYKGIESKQDTRGSYKSNAI